MPNRPAKVWSESFSLVIISDKLVSTSVFGGGFVDPQVKKVLFASDIFVRLNMVENLLRIVTCFGLEIRR